MPKVRNSAPRVGECLALAVVALTLSCSNSAASTSVLSVFERPSQKAVSAQPLNPAAISLSLAGGAPNAVDRTRALLGAVSVAVRQRANPFIIDLDGSEAYTLTSTRTQLLTQLPAATAAANLLASPWRDTGIWVELGVSCPPSANRCMRLYDWNGSDTVERRVRNVVWAWSHAALIRPKGPVAAFVAALRRRAVQPTTTIALVFARSSGQLNAASLAALRREARQAQAQTPPKSPERYWLRAVTHAPAKWSLPVPIAAGDVLVVPRLSALARPQDFVADITAAGDCDWVSDRPGEAGKL